MALQDLNPLRLARSVCSEFLFFPTDSTFFQLRVTLEHYLHGPLNAAPSFAKGIAAEGMTPVGVTKLDFQCLGQRMDTGTLALACCVLHPVLLLLSVFKAAPNTIYETNPYSFPIEQHFLILNEFAASQF